MKKFTIILISMALVSLFFPSCDGGGTDPTEPAKFQKMYGGSKAEEAYSIVQTTDGGYILAGTKYVNVITDVDQNDFYILKLDSVGNISWDKRIGALNRFSYARSIRQTDDGGYIVAGYTDAEMINSAVNHITTGTAYNDGYVAKLDASGNIEWENMYGGGLSDEIYSIRQTGDGGYIMAGSSSSTDINGATNNGGRDIYIVKLANNGEIEWQKLYGGAENDSASSIIQTADGGYIISILSGFSDILKLDSNGAIEWNKSIDGDKINDIHQTDDGGYIAGGTGIYKLDKNGAIEWKNTSYSAAAIQQTSDGGYVATQMQKYAVVKLDSSGNAIWDNSFGGTKCSEELHLNCYYWLTSDFYCEWVPYDSTDIAAAIQQTSDGGYIVAGYSDAIDISGVKNNGGSDIYVVKLDADGNVALIE